MENFLKKYSDVPNGFIEDFFSIAKESYNDNDISIDFEKVTLWLNVKKGNLKRLLIANFQEKYDYKLNKIKVNNKVRSGSNYVDQIYITPDCFKELCMLSQTPKAKEVRRYYLSIEKLIRKYHNYIQEKLYEKINLLEANQKPKVNIKGGVIYFFKALNDIKIDDLDPEELLKIGKTINDKNRFNTYNSGNVNNIDPIFIVEVDNIDKVENCIKNLLKERQYRKHKEIYKIRPDVLKQVFTDCKNLVEGFEKYVNEDQSRIFSPRFKKIKPYHHIILYFDKNS